MKGFILVEIIVPSVVFGYIIANYIQEILGGTYRINGYENANPIDGALQFFGKMREGWVNNMYLSGQAAANTTRDYIRVLVFLAGNSILIASILMSFATKLKPSQKIEDLILTVKLASCVVVFVIIFILLLQSIRFMLHFRYCAVYFAYFSLFQHH